MKAALFIISYKIKKLPSHFEIFFEKYLKLYVIEIVFSLNSEMLSGNDPPFSNKETSTQRRSVIKQTDIIAVLIAFMKKVKDD